MKNLQSTYPLTRDVGIPCIGYGTWLLKNDASGAEAVKQALSAGYRHIDTASYYGNEEAVGQAVRESGIPREEIFLTTKLWNDVGTYEDALASFARSRARLGTEYVDLLLIHWPRPDAFRHCWQRRNAELWRALEHLLKAGEVRAIGVSNFLPHHLEELFQTAEIRPMADQIELSPGYLRREAVEFCQKQGILVEAWSPLARGGALTFPEIGEIARRRGRTPAQVCLRWCLQHGALPLPKTQTPARMAENADVFDFVLSDTDMALLDALPDRIGDREDPDNPGF